MLREPANGSSVPNGDGDGIAAGALGVLDANWTGRATMPSSGASTRTSGAGTRPASRSASHAWTRRGRSAS